MDRQPKHIDYKNYFRNIFIILLWLIPVFILNAGFQFLSRIDFKWKRIEQKKKAEQKLEVITAAADFEYQFSRRAGKFGKILESSAESIADSRFWADHLDSASKRIFIKPFPEYKLITFFRPKNSRRTSILFNNTKRLIGKRMLCNIFDYLVDLSKVNDLSSQDKRRKEKYLRKFLGPVTIGEVVGRSLKGKLAYATIDSLTNLFLWDFKDIPGKGRVGFFFYCPISEKNEIQAKLLALMDFKKQNRDFAGFISLSKEAGPNVLFPELSRSRLFKKWVKNKVKSMDCNFRSWLINGIPLEASLGKYRLFSHLGKSKSHLTVLAVRAEEMNALPAWIYVINLFIFSLVIAVLIRGIWFGVWPQWKLRARFILLFLIASVLPVGLLVISSVGYISQFERSLKNEQLSGLLNSLKQIDEAKVQTFDEYKAAFYEVFLDETIKELLKKHGAKSNLVSKRIERFFSDRPFPLPIMGFAVFDEAGEGVRFYGKDYHSDIVDPSLNTFAYPIVEKLRMLIKEKRPEYKLRALNLSENLKIGMQAYNSLSRNDLVKEVDKRRSYPIQKKIGAVVSTQMHDFIKIDGVENYAILIVWDDSALDKEIAHNTLNQLNLNHPDFKFIIYKHNTQGLKFLINPGRHINSLFKKKAERIARSALLKGTVVNNADEKHTMVALPARKYLDSILVAGAESSSSQEKIFYRNEVLVWLTILALFVIPLSGYFAAKSILEPISRLKKALDDFAKGRRDIDLRQDRDDELGILTHEFSQMVKGVQERERLATLLSDQAIEALSGSQSLGGELQTRLFSGIALVTDIRSFTSLCETSSADDMTDMLNLHFAQMATVITENGGRIYKFIGDAIEAIFPVDKDNEFETVMRAIDTAYLMLKRMEDINKQRKATGKFTYKIGVGLAMGDFTSCPVGSTETRLDYSVIGVALKEAAEIEALTKKCTELPFLINSEMNDLIKGELGDSTIIEGKDFDGYVPNISQNYQDELLKKYESYSFPKLVTDSSEELVTETSGTILKPQKESLLFQYLLGLAFFAFCIGITFWGFQFEESVILRNNDLRAKAYNLRLAEQLKSEDSFRVALETSFGKVIDRCSQNVSFDQSKNENQILKTIALKELDKLKGLGIIPDKFAIYNYQHKYAELDKDQLLNTAFIKGLAGEDKAFFDDFSTFLYKRHFRLNTNKVAQNLRNKFEPQFGARYSPGWFYTEKFGIAIRVRNNEIPKVFYSRFIVKYKPFEGYKNVATSASELKVQKSQKKSGQYRVVGMLMATVPMHQIEKNLRLLVEGYSSEDTQIAILGNNKKTSFFSGSCLKELRKLEYTSKLPKIDLFSLFESELSVAKAKYRLIIAKAQEQVPIDMNIVRWILSAVLFFILIYWTMTIFSKTRITQSLSAKLWAGMLIASIIPIITVFFVIKLFAFENVKSQLAQEEIDLKSFINAFELRQYYSDPLAWGQFKKWSRSENLQKVYELSKVKKNKAKEELKNLFSGWQRIAAEKQRKSMIMLSPVELVMATKNGWGSAALQDKGKKKTVFGELLKNVSQSVIKRLNKEAISAGSKGNLAGAVKSEMTIDIGLGIVRSMFGDSVYMKVANGIGCPAKLIVVSGTVGILVVPFPKIVEPDYLATWMCIFNYHDTLERLARTQVSKYAIFSESLNNFSQFSLPDASSRNLGLAELASWLKSSNLPVSKEINIGNEKFLIHGSPSIVQISSMVLGAVPLSPIIKKAKRLEQLFLLLFGASIIIIFLLSWINTREVLGPINDLIAGMKAIANDDFAYRISLAREDELGDLCKSFNQMNRALEEKELMGKMVSKGAKALSEQADMRSHKSDFGILYIGIPGFGHWLTSFRDDKLFEDLKMQIDKICRIILEENGDIDKMIGDKLLAIFPMTNDSQLALNSLIRAAKRIMAAEQAGELPLPTAIGANCGTVISGFLGVGSKRDFTVIGDAVNVTARIEGVAETLRFERCVLSANLINALDEKIEVREFGEVELKGKAEPLKLFTLL